MKAETPPVPGPLIVQRRLVDGNLFIRASSSGQSANETFTGGQILRCYRTKFCFYFAFPLMTVYLEKLWILSLSPEPPTIPAH